MKYAFSLHPVENEKLTFSGTKSFVRKSFIVCLKCAKTAKFSHWELLLFFLSIVLFAS